MTRLGAVSPWGSSFPKTCLKWISDISGVQVSICFPLMIRNRLDVPLMNVIAIDFSTGSIGLKSIGGRVPTWGERPRCEVRRRGCLSPKWGGGPGKDPGYPEMAIVFLRTMKINRRNLENPHFETKPVAMIFRNLIIIYIYIYLSWDRKKACSVRLKDLSATMSYDHPSNMIWLILTHLWICLIFCEFVVNIFWLIC